MKIFRTQGELSIRLFERSTGLPQEWNELLPSGHFLEAGELRTYEDADLPDVSFLYALVTVSGVPVAAAYFQVLAIREQHLNTALLKPWQRMAWTAFTGAMRPKLLVAGHLFRHDVCSFFSKEGLGDFEAFHIYRSVIRRAVRHCCAQAVLVKDVNTALVPYFHHYAPEYLLLRNDISMGMELDPAWQSLGDYERALKHKYAQRLRKVRQAWAGLEVRELSAEEVEQHKDLLYRLYRQVSARQQVTLGLLSEDFLPLLKRRHPDKLRVWMAMEGATPVAFFSAWDHQENFDMFYIGLDYARNDALHLYFNILFFAVEQAILLRRKRLILGRTALEAKARLGCRPAYLSTYLYIRSGLLRQVINRLSRSINRMEGEWENRHPFKLQAASRP